MYQGIRRPTPEEAVAALEVGQHLTLEVTKYKKNGKLIVQFLRINPQDNFDMNVTIDLLASEFAKAFSQNFGMKCKIIDVV
jgi:hypothetical protein